MNVIREIKSPILKEMEIFESKFHDALKSNVPLLNKIMHYIIKRKGKQMRPMFVFLTAKLFGELKEQSYRAASLIELLHTATLVHDDVIDEANLRRGFFSIKALWKNKAAVLIGDFLLSKGLLLSIENNDFDLLKIVSYTVKEMSEGELLQIEKSRKLDITEDTYFKIIKKKTAVLIASCCACGGSSMSQNKQTIDQLRLFGENVGIAFQIKDDLFDYSYNSKIGKPTGIDIRQQKMTLPLIYALNHTSKQEKKIIINIFKNHYQEEDRISDLINIVKRSGGLNYATKKMKEYHSLSINILNQFPESKAKESLIKLVDYIIDRKK